jgi:acyl dehydratase
MTPMVAHGLEGVRALPLGKPFGPGSPVEITADMVGQFADLTDDHQWIHVDAERSKRESPFGGPIAHGYLTLALIPRMMPEILTFSGFAMTVNYGCDRVRFPAPVPVGSRVRATAAVKSVTDIPNGVQVAVEMTIAVEGAEKPSCVAITLLRHYTRS